MNNPWLFCQSNMLGRLPSFHETQSVFQRQFKVKSPIGYDNCSISSHLLKWIFLWESSIQVRFVPGMPTSGLLVYYFHIGAMFSVIHFVSINAYLLIIFNVNSPQNMYLDVKFLVHTTQWFGWSHWLSTGSHIIELQIPTALHSHALSSL